MTTSSSSSSKNTRRACPPSSLGSTATKKPRGAGVDKSSRIGATAAAANDIRRQLPRHKLLKAKRVQDITLVRYSAALREFDQYMKRRKLKCTSIQRVDRYMAEYFADLCDQGASYNSATYVLFGYLMLRADECIPDKQLMSHSRAALKGWSSKYPQCSRTGADPLIWFLLGSHMHASFAAALLLQLDTYARPSEILKLRKQDII